jgi:phosphoribosyl 1,2-cyclic phosphate phosphodiesterase
VAQMVRTGRDLHDVKTIVFTHQHSDHIVPSELEWMSGPFTNTPPATPVDIFGNTVVCEMITKEFDNLLSRNIALQSPLMPLQEITTKMGDVVLPLPAEHVEKALVLRITRDNKTLFWGHDSGLYPAETMDALASGPTLDIAVFDTTYGGQVTRNRGHMGVDGVVQMVTELRRRGAITDKTKCVATHFSHNGGLMHEELVEAFLPHRIMVAFDGMIVRA